MEITFSDQEFDPNAGDERKQLYKDANSVLIKLLQEIEPVNPEDADDPREASTVFLWQCGYACVDFTEREALASIRIITGPTMVPLSREYSDDEILSYIREAKSGRRKSEIAAKTIFAGPPEHKANDKAMACLEGTPNLFVRAGLPSRIVQGAELPGIKRPPTAPTIETLSAPALRELLSERATWLNAKGKLALVPDWVAKMLLERSTWPVPHLEAIIDAPTLRADGTIVTRKGIDTETGLYLTEDWSLPPMTVADAKANLDYVVCDFPFAGPRDLAAWVAALLTPLARHAFHGPVPMFLFSASDAGCGKSLLMDATGHITMGRSMSRTAFTEDTELRKKMTGLALSGDPSVLLDNLPSQISSPLLDLLLTSTSWTDRILGLTKTVTLQLLWTIYGNGNNTIATGDTARRVLYSYLQALMENPSSRDTAKFAEPDLLGYIAANRPRLLASALKILTHFIEAGRPDMKLPGFGSFEAWSGLVRSAVVFAGWVDPVTPLSQSEDPQKDMLRSLIAGWREADPNGLGLLASEAYERRGQFPTLGAAIAQLPPGNDLARQLGYTIRSLQNRVVDGVAFKKAGVKHNTTLWKVSP